MKVGTDGMKIELAKNGGFCFGVRRAVEAVMACAGENGEIYTLGPIIHNPQVVDRLAQQGVRVIDDLSEVDQGTVVIRSHGVPPEVFQQAAEKGIQLVDATCPYVKKIQDRVTRAYREGMPVIIIGEPDHPEVKGVAGWSHYTAKVVNSEQDVQALPDMERACIVAQTTISRKRWDELLAGVAAHVKQCDVFPSICNATSVRQQEAVEIAKRVECVIVVGGRNSSNTRHLYELCSKNCGNTIHIESANELSAEAVKVYKSIGIISGASTPDWIIKEVFDKMSDILNDGTGMVPETAEEPAEGNFLEDMEKTLVQIRSGQILTGKVVSANEKEVCVNIGYKADGFISKEEFSPNGDVLPLDVVKEGDEIEVEVLKVNDGDGNVLLSKKNVDGKRNWSNLLETFEKDKTKVYDGIGRQAVKGGLLASINGIRTFIPASHLDTRYVDDIDEYVGQPMRLMILEIEKPRRRVVASHKLVMLEEEAAKKKNFYANLKEGDVVTGTVRRLTDFGAFVDIGGADGLVHVTDLVWGRVPHPRDVVSVGEQVQVIILKVDVEKERISLGMKQIKPRPWDVAREKYAEGDIIQGKVVRIVTFGAFVEIEPGLDGLIHISQIADHRIEKVEDILSIGQTVTVKILSIQPEDKRISLSIRAVLAESGDMDYEDDFTEDYE